MEKVINRLINDAVENSDKYTRNGSTWLIFTDKKKWIIELTEDRTLWYNYDFFKSLFSYVCLDVIENQHYITKWVENYVLRDGRKLDLEKRKNKEKVEDAIQNGVKDTKRLLRMSDHFVEDTIQNGVRRTLEYNGGNVLSVEDAIQNGVKDTDPSFYENSIGVEDIIQNGVKDTFSAPLVHDIFVEDTLQNGVKETAADYWIPTSRILDAIEKGDKEMDEEKVKYTQRRIDDRVSQIDYVIEHSEEKIINTKYMKEWVNTEGIVGKVIKNGIKEVQPLPSQDGNKDWGIYYQRQEDRTKPHTEYVKDVLNNGDIY